MKLTEKQIRSLTRNLLRELFTRKSGIGLGDFLGGPDNKSNVDPWNYGMDSGDFDEADEKLEETEEEE